MTHLAGAALAAAGTVFLIVLTARTGDAWRVVGTSVYGAMLVSLYAASTLYHSVGGEAKRTLRKFDHCAIYLLIAGTYTPFALVSLRGPVGWTLFGVAWSLALVGIVQEIWLAKGARTLSLVLYLVMGWLALAAVVPLVSVLHWNGMGWLAAGGVFYTIGIVFYVQDERIRHGHGIWHLFVLGGSACHYFAVLFHVV